MSSTLAGRAVTEHTASTARHTKSYLACGRDDGPLMIFVHGWPELSLSWRHQLPCFLAHPEPLTTRIGERPMSRETAMPGSGYRHGRQPRPQQQMDLFGSAPSNGTIGAPAWPELPAEARAALTSLMAQLILEHAATTGTLPRKEVGHDL